MKNASKANILALVLSAASLCGCLGKMEMRSKSRVNACPDALQIARLVSPLEAKVPSSTPGEEARDYAFDLREFVAAPEKSGTTEEDETEACFAAGEDDCLTLKTVRIFNDSLSEKEFRAYLPSAPHVQGMGASLDEALRAAMAHYQSMKAP